VTIQDAYPLPHIDESLDALAGSKYFSTLELLSGYRQVPLSPERPREGSAHHAGRAVEAEGVAVRVDLRPGHLPEADGTSR